MIENNQEYWNEGYWKRVINNQKNSFENENWLDKYKEIINKIEGNNAVDLGCGIGQDTKWLIDNGFDVISCDISNIALEKLKELIQNSKTLQIDMRETLPFKENSINLVNADLSIHYFCMKDTIRIFNEINRILTPNGILIGRVNSDKNEGYIREETKIIEDNYYYDFEKYFRLFNKEQFDILSENWKTIVLNEDIITRVNKKKVLWEFIFQKI